MITEIRCSQLARPMVCAGFTAFENLPEQPTTPEAEEGTACGELLERKLLGIEIPKQARNGIYFDGDMEFYVNPLVEKINEIRSTEILCEQRIDWRTRSGIWIRGTYDVSFVDKRGWLHISDLKYGFGIVEVKPNWQLLGYAIGEVIRRGIAFPKIVLTIEQPRPHHEDGPSREWVMDYAELLGYKEQIEQRMEAIASGARDLQTGPQCKYCAATAEACPAFNRLFYRALEVSYQFTQDSINEDELSRQLDQAKRAEEVLEIRLKSLKELAVSRIKSGKLVPNYIAEQSLSDRQWKPGLNPNTIKMLTGKSIVQEKMLSPAQAEKAGLDKKFVNAMVTRHFLGQKLVRKDAGKEADKIFGDPNAKAAQ